MRSGLLGGVMVMVRATRRYRETLLITGKRKGREGPAV